MNIQITIKSTVSSGWSVTAVCYDPMNLMKNKVADYIVTGQWAKKAAKGSRKIWKGKCCCILSG